MKEPYSEDLASHAGPESCAAAREAGALSKSDPILLAKTDPLTYRRRESMFVDGERTDCLARATATLARAKNRGLGEVPVLVRGAGLDASHAWRRGMMSLSR